jgi:outer membrane receptor protein involved in Fe transport
MFSLWNRYTFKNDVDFLKGVSVGFGGRYSSSAAISSSPTTTVRNPSFVVMNAMMSRSFIVFQRKVRVQANVSNLADKVYRDGANGMFGPPRKYFLTLDTRF